MSKYEVIKNIMKSTRLDDDFKVKVIQSYLLNWYTEEDIKWIWE